MQSCNYIQQHYFLLRENERNTSNYFKYHPKVTQCPKCNKSSTVKYVVKCTKSKGMINSANIAGTFICNPYGSGCKPNDRFYCKKCEIFF
ncbi:MAG: hypothetical protein MJ252_11315 [archaeon]|nr:hypothetical protein [archaeon]